MGNANYFSLFFMFFRYVKSIAATSEVFRDVYIG